MSASLFAWEFRPRGGLPAVLHRFPGVVGSVHPLGFRWLVRCRGPGPSLEAARSDREIGPSSVRVGGPPAPDLAFAYSPRAFEVAIVRSVTETRGFVVPPMIVRDGTLQVRCILPGSTTDSAARRRVRDGRLITRRTLTAERYRHELDRLALPGPELSGRQTEVLLAAVEAGYYEVPRRATVAQIAHGLGLGRSTTEEHLRRAESAVVRSTAPLVELAQWEISLDSDPPDERFVRFCPELELYVHLAMRGDRVVRVGLGREPPVNAAGVDHPVLARILDHVRTGRDDLRDVPISLDVPAFEREVLEELRRIPIGETRSYGEIAARIGRPDAARAVGNACGHNPVPILVPCHRVVPSHGGIGEYSAEGGALTKRRLLAREGALRARKGAGEDRGR